MAKMQGWTPRLRGSIYCSPRCGGNCKRADYDRAKKRSAALAKRLGPGWVPQVWENLGWHYTVSMGSFEIYPHHDRSGRRPKLKDSYSAYLQMSPQFYAVGDTAEGALNAVCEVARGAAVAINRSLMMLEAGR